MYCDVLEGALKILETVRQGVAGYDIEEFFHGIYNSITDAPTSSTWLPGETISQGP